MRWILPLLTTCLLSTYSCYSQEYSYTHYDISDGLAGSTVYCITQDKQGFIWLGTEAGVSRFDGTHFHNFTTKDGLPDVEVLEMFADSRGRVWMAPFRKSVCYYFEGKIHNQDNDSLLRRLAFKGNVENFAEDAAGNVLVQESSALHLICPDGRIGEIDSIHGVHIQNCHAVSKSVDGHFLVEARDSLFYFDGKDFRIVFALPSLQGTLAPNFVGLSSKIAIWHRLNTTARIRSVTVGDSKDIPFHFFNYRHVSYTILDDTIVCVNESTGTTLHSMHSDKVGSFLNGVEVSRTFRDDEGDLWFTTIGRGLYRLNSAEFKNISLKQKNYEDCAVNSIKKIGKELLIGSSRNSVYRFLLPGMQALGVQQLNRDERKRITFIDTLTGGRMVYGTDFTIDLKAGSKPWGNEIRTNVKAAHLLSDGQLLVASSAGLLLVDLDKGQIVDTIMKERTTTLVSLHDTTYIGTLNGLYRMTKDHRITFLGQNIPFLRKRIASIVESWYGVLWIAPYDDAGIIGLKGDKVIRRIGQKQGLTSDICRTLAIEGDLLWAGTDKGLNRIDLRNPDGDIVQYSSHDGLGSNVINTLFLDSPMVYVGTPAGLTYFDETRVDPHSGCRFNWLDISSSGKNRIADSAHLVLPYQENNIRFDYAGISYKSSGTITYRYRLLGLDTAWKFTRETFLDYPTLPPGEYDLQISAVNKFGSESPQAELHIYVKAPFWKTGWFMAIVGIALVSLAWLVVSLRIKYIRTRQEEERQLARKMNEMEHMALQAQMNPHFIFNCLNSIQQYIFDQDIFAANKYITGFSKLIRSTLHNSSQSFISLADEVTYLSTYLSLEKVRFKEKMDYTIEVAPDINPETMMIPPMMIQPYVENSMRHGLRHKVNSRGRIWIRMSLAENRLIVVIEDNGIGREKAASYKTVEHIEYQSKGMSLTANRIGLINTLYGEGIGVEVLDLKDSDGRPLGTRVVMKFPLFVKAKKKRLP
jgi:ligand-binding sensor domain-containing protein/two-component sensor histidine kinase